MPDFDATGFVMLFGFLIWFIRKLILQADSTSRKNLKESPVAY